MHYNQVNEYMSGHGNVNTPEIGMGATRFVGSDRYPYVVMGVPSKRRVVVMQIHESNFETMFDKDENGVMRMKPEYLEKYYLRGYENLSTFTYRKNHRWMPLGDDAWGTGALQIGCADEYMDPSF